MDERISKLKNLVLAPSRVDRIRTLLEIRLNKLLIGHKPSTAMGFDDLLKQLDIPDLVDLLRPGGESEEAVASIRADFAKAAADTSKLPFPIFYNADKSLALLTYSLTRYLRPEVVVETGVAYGITSALILLAMARNDRGTLTSIDLPPLSDPRGTYTGLVIPSELRSRWTLHLGSSRKWLARVLEKAGSIGLFISDSASVYSLQQFEFETAWRQMAKNGAAIFGNTSARFDRRVMSVPDARHFSIAQMEKPPCVTALLLRN